mgnify:CR=1 FL=1|jgi:Fe-Mn family superoxide dismutase|tara:strand:- start:7371 stop:7904 length:534 start_codon:yes stop_codon:yes gene_type:complete
MRLEQLTEEKQILVQERLPYKRDALNPVMSKDTVDYHFGKLAKAYVDKFNTGKGDAKFNEAGAFLHNIFFPQLKEPSGANKPHGEILQFIIAKFGNYDTFKQEFKDVAMSLQGSGWVYLAKNGTIKTIPNHALRGDILVLVDWWEHAWALDYQSDKEKYLNNIWKIIDWDKVNVTIK